MNINQNNYTGTDKCTVAVAQCDGILAAVRMRKQRGQFEILDQNSSPGSLKKIEEYIKHIDWLYDAKNSEPWIAGHDGTGLMFRTIEIPRADEDHTNKIIRVQAQALMPFAPDNLQAVWKCRDQGNMQKVMVAAGQKQNLAGLTQNLEKFACSKICPIHHAIVGAWTNFFDSDDQPAVIISINQNDSLICLAEQGKLTNAGTIDIGIKDFQRNENAAAQNFAQLTNSLADMFDIDLAHQGRIRLLSDASAQMKNIAEKLNLANLPIEQSLPNTNVVKGQNLNQSEIYKLRYALGLCALEIDGDALDLAEGLWTLSDKKNRLKIGKLPAAISMVLAAMILLLVVSYQVDKHRLNSIEKAFAQSSENTSIYSLWQNQKLVATLAKNRVDILTLFETISQAADQSVEVDEFDYKLKKGVVITGVSKTNEALYKFEQNLQAVKNVSDVKMKTSKITDKNRKGVGFNISFKYHAKSKIDKVKDAF